MTTNAKTLTAGSGVDSIVEIDDKTYINTSGGGGGVSDHGALAGLTDNDHPQYVLNSDFVSSGYQTAAELTASGLRSDHLSLGVDGQYGGVAAAGGLQEVDRFLIEQAGAGEAKKYIDGTTLFEASKDYTEADLHTSGYIRNADLIGSGYVENLNGLTTDISIVGSGSIIVWEDGQTIQIASTGGGGGGGGSPESDQYPVDARAVSGLITPDTSGVHSLGAEATPFDNLYVEDVWAASGFYVSGVQIPHSLNDLGGPISIVGSGGTSVWVDGQTIQVSASGGGGGVSSIETATGAVTFDANQGLAFSNGSATTVKAELDLSGSGFTTLSAVQEDLHTSGYVRQTDIVGSGDIDVWVDGNTVQIGYVDAGGGSTTTSGTHKLTWNFVGAVPSGGMSGVDGGRFCDVEHHISGIALWSHTPSGNVVVTLSSGAPGSQPVGMYTGEAKPTASGNWAIDSGNMPNTRIIPANMVLYCDIEEAPNIYASGMTLELLVARNPN